MSLKKEDYGDQYQNHYLEMYKMYVQMADNVSARRQSANSFFLTVNTAILGFIGYFNGAEKPWGWTVNIAGIILCYTWYRLVRSYKDLNSGKFKVIHEMEQKLPLSPYDDEWVALGSGKDSNLYLPFTEIEIWIPRIFGSVYFIVLITGIPWTDLSWPTI